MTLCALHSRRIDNGWQLAILVTAGILTAGCESPRTSAEAQSPVAEREATTDESEPASEATAEADRDQASPTLDSDAPTPSEPKGAAGISLGEPSPCARPAQAMGQELGAIATITGLPARREELGRISCKSEESRDDCLDRVERSWRAENQSGEVDFRIRGGRVVTAELEIEGTPDTLTFSDVDEVTAFLETMKRNGTDARVVNVGSQIDPKTRVVVVERTVEDTDPHTAEIMLPEGHDTSEVRRVAQRHGLSVAYVKPMGEFVRLTVNCSVPQK